MIDFTNKKWNNLGKLDIYSTEADNDGPTLADQMDAGVPGGANPSDNTDSAPPTNEVSDDINLGDFDEGSIDSGSDNGSGSEDMGGTDEGGDTSSDLGGNTTQNQNPNENPFKKQNGKVLLDDKLAELQTAVSDILERIYAKPQIEQVVVSELENLADSIRNIRETVFIVPVDASLYKYQLSVISYKNLSKLICDSLSKDK